MSIIHVCRECGEEVSSAGYCTLHPKAIVDSIAVQDDNENGYAISPLGHLEMNLTKALQAAREASLDAVCEYKAIVEDCDTQKTIARFENGTLKPTE
jgi:hypothetical protein